MATPPKTASDGAVDASTRVGASARSQSFSQQSQASNESQTAADFIRSQELLEADAREALPYSIESCTNILGPLRQVVLACLTCNPPPTTSSDAWTPAGVCYACSVQCHGEHTLVEIFQKRNFTCDCGTTRFPSTSPCSLRTNAETNTRGGVHSEAPDANNKYNQNFRNRFCGCECDYDPFQQKGTMFQCLGLGSPETGGCGEDWYHPGCLVGMGPKWFDKMKKENSVAVNGDVNGHSGLATISEGGPDANQQDHQAGNEVAVEDDDDPPMPPGFPEEEEFEGFLCYKCVESNPWIKRYAGTSGFLPAVALQPQAPDAEAVVEQAAVSKKRKADEHVEEQGESKRAKSEAHSDTGNPAAALPEENPTATSVAEPPTSNTLTDCKLPNLPLAPSGRFSLFFREDFRDKFCRCSTCYRHLNKHPQLLEEEEFYEAPMSADGDSQHGGSGGSLYDRGENALRSMDRVRAIEGAMAYNHLKERLKPFFQQFADSGEAIGAEDVKAYFAKLRGDEEGIKEAGEAAAESAKDGNGKGGGEGGPRHEQSGY